MSQRFHNLPVLCKDTVPDAADVKTELYIDEG